MTNEIINGIIAEMEEMENRIKELKALVDEKKTILKAELDERQVEMLETDKHKVFYKAIEKNSLDTKKAKTALEKIGKLNECMKNTVELRFTITTKAE